MTFPSREAIWKDHLFDQLLKWVNEKLAPARWLRLSGTGGKGNRGITWAWLISDESELDELDRELIHLKGFKPLGGIRTYEYDVGYVRNWLIELRPETK